MYNGGIPNNLEVTQIGFDRAISIVFDAKMGKRELIIECFRNGNLILLDENRIIIAPLTHTKIGGRIIKKGFAYEPPKGAINPYNLTIEELQEIFAKSDLDLVKTLAIHVNLGGQIAELICKKSNLDNHELSIDISESKSKLNTIFTELNSILVELKNSDLGGYLLLKSDTHKKTYNEIKEAENLLARDKIFSELTFESSPIKTLEKKDILQIHFENYNDAIDAWYGQHDSGATARRIHEKMISEQPKGLDTESDKLSRRLNSQKKSLEKFDKEINENRTKGLVIQENSQQIDYLISEATQTIDDIGWNDFSKKALEFEYISQVNAKEKKMLLKLPNEAGDVWISIENSAQLNAQVYFSKDKKVKDKS